MKEHDPEGLATSNFINELVQYCGNIAKKKGFHKAIKDMAKNPDFSALCIRLLLLHTEISEAVTNLRDAEGLSVIEEELADIVIRVFDLAQTLSIDLGSVLVKKIAKNLKREKKHGHKNF